MNKKTFWTAAAPHLVLGLSILVCTAVAVFTANSTWLVGAGPVLFALSIVGVDMLAARLRGAPAMPSWSATIMASVFLVACGISVFRNPASVAMMIPVLGSGAATTILLRPKVRSGRCSF